MKKQFLKKLNRALKPLKMKERKKCLNIYEELILDKIENGITEENAIADLGTIKQIANEILNSYVKIDGQTRKNFQKYFNNIYILFDAIIIFISYILAYFLYYKLILSTYSSSIPFTKYLAALILIIPCYIIIYNIFKLYTIECAQKQYRKIWNLLGANIVGLMLFALVLYLFNLVYFSRALIVLFAILNTIIITIARNFIFFRFSYYHK